MAQMPRGVLCGSPGMCLQVMRWVGRARVSQRMTKMLGWRRPTTPLLAQEHVARGAQGVGGCPQVSTTGNTGNTALWPSALGPSSSPAETGRHAPAHRVCLQGTGEGQDGLR